MEKSGLLLSIGRSAASASPITILSVSCKARNRNVSAMVKLGLPSTINVQRSQSRKQQIKRSSLGKPQVNVKSKPNNGEVTEVPKKPDDFSNNIGMLPNKETTPTEEVRDRFIKVNGDDQALGIRLEDLIGMVKNAERNILLLNEARVHALEDLDKILAEKEMLQGQINMLEMKLAETDERIKVSAQEKEHVKMLEGELAKLKNEVSSGATRDSLNHVHTAGSIVPNQEHSSLDEDLKRLRSENASLKDDIEALKMKVDNVEDTDQRVISLEKEKSLLVALVSDLESRLAAAQEDVIELSTLKSECKALLEKDENSQGFLGTAMKQADQTASILQQNDELQRKVEKLEASLEEANMDSSSLEKTQQYNQILHERIKILEEHLQMSDEEINSHIQIYQAAVKEFQETLENLREESKRKSSNESSEVMPLDFWSRLLLMIDGWLLEKRISTNDARLLREMAWKKDARIRDAYFDCNGKTDNEVLSAFLKLTSSRSSLGLHIIHMAAEMAPIAKVGGLGDVVSGLSKALQRRGHLVEIILPKYDCIQNEQVADLRKLDMSMESYFGGQLFKNKIWVGTVEGLPVYFIEPQHPANFFGRGTIYGEHDDFKRFSFFSRAALELVYRAGKKPDIIHCHDWQTAFVPPLYWEIYAAKGCNSARICFTCHNFEYQGTAPASDLASCGLDVHELNRPDRMQDNNSHDRINLLKGATVFSNIVTTVSPTYADEVRTAEGGRGLHETLNFHSKKFVGILNGIDTDAWNPSTDTFLSFQYNADDLQGKVDDKNALRKQLRLSAADNFLPLVGCVTRLVPQKGVHLIRHAIYRTIELGGQFVLLGSSPVHHIQREFEDIASHFQNHPHVRLVLKYDEALSHSIYAGSDMVIIPSIFEPCGLTQMIAMRYGSVPIVRQTGGLNDSVFDVDDDTIPSQFRNGFTFFRADEDEFSNALERAFRLYMTSPEKWQELVQKNMRSDFSWDSSSALYEDLYEKVVARARAAAR